MANQFRLGQKFRCKVTGWEGIAVGRIEYLNGCVQYGLKSRERDKEGKLLDAVYIDSQQLELVDEGIYVDPQPTGGPAPSDAPRI